MVRQLLNLVGASFLVIAIGACGGGGGGSSLPATETSTGGDQIPATDQTASDQIPAADQATANNPTDPASQIPVVDEIPVDNPPPVNDQPPAVEPPADDPPGGSGTAAKATVTLAWDAPTTHTDGTSIVGLSGYKIYYGTTSGTYTQTVDAANVLNYSLELAPGTYYFTVTAYTVSGKESDPSNEVSRSVP